MLKLLRLEYLFNRRQILINMAIISVFFAYMAARIDSPRVLIVTASLMIGLAMPFMIIGREDKFKTPGLVCSLPVRRSTVVLGKYAATWAANLLGLGYALLFTTLLPFSKIPVGGVLTVRNLLVSLLLMSLLFAVTLPFTIRFGLTGVIILLVGCQLLGILTLLLAQFIGGAKNPLRVFFRAVEGGLRSLLNHETTAGYALALLAAIVAVNAVSLLISRALYARRDL